MIKRNEKKLKFNIVDVFVLLLALLCIATIVNRALVIEDKYQPVEPSNYIIRFEIELTDTIQKNAAKNILAGHTLKTADGENLLGAILENAAYTDDTKTKIFSRFVANGLMTIGGLKLENNVILNIGDEVEIETELVKTTIKIVSIDNE